MAAWTRAAEVLGATAHSRHRYPTRKCRDAGQGSKYGVTPNIHASPYSFSACAGSQSAITIADTLSLSPARRSSLPLSSSAAHVVGGCLPRVMVARKVEAV